MRVVITRLMLAFTVSSLSLVSARAEKLKIVEVSAPAINCLFDRNCRVEVDDSTDSIPIGASGDNFLQSRTFKGQQGSIAAGLYVYEYRIDLRRATGILHRPCIDSLTLNFGPIVRTLDYDGDGERGEEIFVVTRGGLGSVGLDTVSQTGNRITFRFSRPVCSGGRPDSGDSTFFFGLVSTHSPTKSTATVSESTGQQQSVQVRVAREKDPVNDEISQGPSVEEPIPNPNRQNADANNRIPMMRREANHPSVDSLSPKPCVERGGLVTVSGSNFGRSPNGRVVELGGHGIGVLLQVRTWSNSRITAIVPNDPRIQLGQWYYIGLQNRERHWISNISRTISICRGME